MKVCFTLLFATLLSVFAIASSPLPHLPPSESVQAVRTTEEIKAPSTLATSSALLAQSTSAPVRATEKVRPPDASAPRRVTTLPATHPTQPPAEKPVAASSSIEDQILFAMNNERTSRGLPAFVRDTALADLARAHSEDMRTHGYFSHAAHDGCSVSCRADRVGYHWRMIAENIYWMQGYALDATATRVVESWMQSAGHRANILGSTTHAGVGIATIDNRVYVTAIYATPR